MLGLRLSTLLQALIGVAWFVLPVVLAIVCFSQRAEIREMKKLLRKLADSGRLSEEEKRANGLSSEPPPKAGSPPPVNTWANIPPNANAPAVPLVPLENGGSAPSEGESEQPLEPPLEERENAPFAPFAAPRDNLIASAAVGTPSENEQPLEPSCQQTADGVWDNVTSTDNHISAPSPSGERAQNQSPGRGNTSGVGDNQNIPENEERAVKDGGSAPSEGESEQPLEPPLEERENAPFAPFAAPRDDSLIASAAVGTPSENEQPLEPSCQQTADGVWDNVTSTDNHISAPSPSGERAQNQSPGRGNTSGVGDNQNIPENEERAVKDGDSMPSESESGQPLVSPPKEPEKAPSAPFAAPRDNLIASAAVGTPSENEQPLEPSCQQTADGIGDNVTSTDNHISAPSPSGERAQNQSPGRGNTSGVGENGQPLENPHQDNAAFPETEVRTTKKRVVKKFKVSAISAMLGVGVLLVVFAGLVFVRSSWDALADWARLSVLAALALVFFGASALVSRMGNIKSTGMAFFTLGAVFLPISVWAAGYFHLLGDTLAGGTNALLLALCFASFGGVSLIAVRRYKHPAWGVAFLAGLSFGFLALARYIAKDFNALFALLAAIYTAALVTAARYLKPRLPQALRVTMEPFALGFAFFAALAGIWAVFTSRTASRELYGDAATALAGIALLILGTVFLAPVTRRYLKNFSAAPLTVLYLCAFHAFFYPLYRLGSAYDAPYDALHAFWGTSLLELSALVCAATLALFLLIDALPQEVSPGFRGAFALTAVFGVLLSFFGGEHFALLIALGVLAGLTVALALKDRSSPRLPRAAAALCVWAFCLRSTAAPEELDSFPYAWEHLPLCAAMALCALLFTLIKPLRCVTGNLLFPATLAVSAISALSKKDYPPGSPLFETAPENALRLPALLLAAAFGLLAALWFLRNALREENTPFLRYTSAALAAAVPGFMASASHIGAFAYRLPEGALLSIWCAIAFSLAFGVYFTVKNRFDGVRRLIFALGTIPPVLSTAVWCFLSDWKGFTRFLPAVICTLAALLIAKIFANRGFRALASVSLGAALLLAVLTTYLARFRLAPLDPPYIPALLSSFWLPPLCVLAILILKGKARFVGARSMARITQIAAPLMALTLSGALLFSHAAEEWSALFFLYTLLFLALSWFVTEPGQVFEPAGCALALILALESARRQAIPATNGFHAFLTVCCALGLTALFHCLGSVEREDKSAKDRARGYTLTLAGCAVPVWLLCVALAAPRSEKFTEWLLFFVPVLAAACMVHFVTLTKKRDLRRLFWTLAAAFGVIAFWLQPLTDFEGTYWEGKIGLVPLLAFGVVLRLLYGEKAGGTLLFAIGAFCMLRLGAGAVISGSTADALTVLILSLVIFIVSFLVRQKKWFLLGGISLLVSALYINLGLSGAARWWITLLAAGLLLIAIAAVNETLKRRGDARAGRFWSDWKW